MRTAAVVGIVVGLHCVVVGSVVLVQGCRRTAPAVVKETQTVMPPVEPRLTPFGPPSQ